jgi:phospholipase D1/2
VIWDVFLLDSDFRIERPTRYFRQGLNLLHPDTEQAFDDAKNKAAAYLAVEHDASHRSITGTIKGGISRIFHPHRHRSNSEPGHGAPSTIVGDQVDDDTSSSSSSSEEEHEHASNAPMLDPSINVNPLIEERNGIRHVREKPDEKKKKNKSGEVSKHTFYIENSQTRLKLYARNEVRFHPVVILELSTFVRLATNASMDSGLREDCGHFTLPWR